MEKDPPSNCSKFGAWTCTIFQLLCSICVTATVAAMLVSSCDWIFVIVVITFLSVVLLVIRSLANDASVLALPGVEITLTNLAFFIAYAIFFVGFSYVIGSASEVTALALRIIGVLLSIVYIVCVVIIFIDKPSENATAQHEKPPIDMMHTSSAVLRGFIFCGCMFTVYIFFAFCIWERLSITVIEADPVEPPIVLPGKSSRYKEYWAKQEVKERQQGEYNMEKRIDLIVKSNNDPLPPRVFKGSAIEMCEGNNNTLCVPKFKRFESRVKVAPQYGLMACIIQKSMSTVMTAIMCYLYNEKKFAASGREFSKECIPVRFCQGRNEFGAVAPMRQKYGIQRGIPSNWTFTMITRDPIDRFLSGYVDKCIRLPVGRGYCNGCGRNMTCFIITEHARIMSQLKLKRMHRTYEDRHIFPQNWRCALDREYDNYKFLRYSTDPYETFLPDLLPILEQQKVSSSSIDFIKSEVNKGRTGHATVQSEARTFLERRLRGSPFLMEYLVRIFYYDFTLLNYPFPEGFEHS